MPALRNGYNLVQSKNSVGGFLDTVSFGTSIGVVSLICGRLPLPLHARQRQSGAGISPLMSSPPKFYEMSDDELNRFIADYPDRFDIPVAIDERRKRMKKREAVDADRKHEEAIATSQEANRLSRFAILVAVSAIAISLGAWIFPRDIHDTSQRNEVHLPAVPLSLSNTPATNAVARSNDISTTQSAK